ncbi:MAG: RAD55 family ATPase [Pseudoalteromonas sp.]
MGMTESEMDFLIAKNEFIEHKTGFNFLRQHCGFREGKLHLLIGSTSSGKSTLVRSILFDYLERNPKKKAFLYLTEESDADFKLGIAYSRKKIDTDRVVRYSEQDGQPSKEKLFHMIQKASEENIRFLILDNLTTCQFYNDKPFEYQSSFVKDLKTELTKHHVACFCIAHTSTTANAGKALLDGDSIRGNKSVSNLAEYLYCLEKMVSGNQIGQAITLVKNRNHTADDYTFILKFNRMTRLFNQDFAIPFEEFKQMYNKRNKL